MESMAGLVLSFACLLLAQLPAGLLALTKVVLESSESFPSPPLQCGASAETGELLTCFSAPGIARPAMEVSKCVTKGALLKPWKEGEGSGGVDGGHGEESTTQPEAVFDLRRKFDLICSCVAKQRITNPANVPGICQAFSCGIESVGCKWSSLTYQDILKHPGVIGPRKPTLPSDWDGDIHLDDLSGAIPDIIPHDVVAREGLAYYILFRLIRNLYAVTNCGEEKGWELDDKPMDGWSTVDVLHIEQPAETPSSPHGISPFLWIVEKDDGSSVLIVVRGSISATDYRLAAATDQVDFFTTEEAARLERHVKQKKLLDEPSLQSLTGLLDALLPFLGESKASANGGVRSGYYSIYKAIYPFLFSLLEPRVASGALQRVVVAGHSLGGVVASFVSLGLAAAFIDNAPRVDFVGYGSPRGGDRHFVALLSQLVNARSIEFEHDAITMSPCSLELPCTSPPGLADTTFKAADSSGDDADGNEGGRSGLLDGLLSAYKEVWQYTDWKGRVVIKQQDVGRDFGPLQSDMAHSCSYLCFLVSHFAPSDPVSWCRNPFTSSSLKGEGKESLMGQLCPWGEGNQLVSSRGHSAMYNMDPLVHDLLKGQWAKLAGGSGATE
ncbi:unnamed protein product [Vitrella brassicaformis CCMP3155]|uniref:Fungal lipase-type domain-containing protein n=1 Tax=Vitrella brassicaformis (strain CCMP3155) TaxID=1169540 RepID=A0A0G4GZ71_VITBC|nr:unnamed protein product [Vitrella brassicaformis CCMP3155]|eukprot:CEM36464.1 unnamed protein product [Vitrella brassicaformis CCMP3155]